MARQAQFALGAKASCCDGPCGEVRRMILNPAGCTVSRVVVELGHRRAPGRLVPVDLVDATTGGITLRCTLAEFGQARSCRGDRTPGGLRRAADAARTLAHDGSNIE